MDRITRSYLDDFLKTQQITEKDESLQFELFAGYSILSKEYGDTFDIFDCIVGGGNDCGIDIMGIMVNDRLVNSIEELEDILQISPAIRNTRFIFIQSKTSSGFSTSEIGTFGTGVCDFFNEKPKMKRNEQIVDRVKIIDLLISKLPNMKERPECVLYYVTTGKWVFDENLVGRIDIVKEDLVKTNIFGKVDFIPVDADLIQKYYKLTKNSINRTFELSTKVQLPDIHNVVEAYLGILPVKEYLKLIIDDDGNIIKHVFYDNVRDYLGNNPVNGEISETLLGENPDKFVILNNGVTIVCKELSYVRNTFSISDYQVVNGCQTSHVLFKDKDEGDLSNVFLPIKIISSTDEDTINEIIRATNRQTEVLDEQFIALSEFHKKLENFYNSFEGAKKLFYERRSKQYSYEEDVEKVRVVTVNIQLKAFASMFCDKPYNASRYYGRLVKDVDDIFSTNHELMPYYTSSFALYKLEYLFRSKNIDIKYRKYRFHMLMLLKYIVNGDKKIPQFNSRKIVEYCERINILIYDQDAYLKTIDKMIKILESVISDLDDSENTKKQAWIEKLIKAALNSNI
ncbi:AIPR family protein [Lacrimispora sp.]|jgi:hypothetical protein|uniref:AIPR family protein n=1 Tax=Lacrimispora sp. TaxID=2719234 RepID=UPI0028A0A345|nr:AIPR family protein [Lacrimispora sp.]